MPQRINMAKLRWQCRRGMLELDIVLARLLESAFLHFTDAQKQHFEQMLSVDDPTLYAWLTGLSLPSDKHMQNIVAQCVQYNKNMR